MKKSVQTTGTIAIKTNRFSCFLCTDFVKEMIINKIDILHHAITK